MGATTSTHRVSFSEMQQHIMVNSPSIIISTLPVNKQHCLIPRTVSPKDEEKVINEAISKDKNAIVIVYGTNCNDLSVDRKHKQLIGLGLANAKISQRPRGQKWIFFPSTRTSFFSQSCQN